MRTNDINSGIRDSVLELNFYPHVKLVSFDSEQGNKRLKSQYLQWLNNTQNLKLIGSDELMKRSKKIDFVDKSFDRFSKLNSQAFFIYYKKTDLFVGTIKLDTIDWKKGIGVDGILIGEKEYQGKGIASQAYNILLNYGFTKLKLRKIIGGCNEKNIGMIKIFKRLGYTQEGRFRNVDFIDNLWTDHLYFGIMREEFNMQKALLSP